MIRNRNRSQRALALPLLPAVLWMGVIFTLSAQHHIPKTLGVSIEFTAVAGHLFIYSVLAALLYAGLPRELGRTRRVALAFVIAVAYGASDEFHQSFVPGRDASLGDLLVDASAAAGTLTALARWAPGFAIRWPR
jgi:VanZ family protein